MGRLKKHQSKRQTLRVKYKIQKKVKEYKKKQIKLQKKNPNLFHKRKRDPGIPNNWPFKAALLAEIEQHREIEKQVQQQQKQEKKDKDAERKSKIQIVDKSVLPASISTITSNKNTDPDTILEMRTRQTLRILKEVVTSSSLILFCLDARDPLGSRWIEMEKKILTAAANTKISDSNVANSPPVIFVLTHADCIPSSVLAAWLRYLNVEQPTVAFYSNHRYDESANKQPSTRKAQHKRPAWVIESQQQCPSIEPLRKLISNYRSKGSANNKTITVSVMGFENVGKSSVINALTYAANSGVSEMTGYTKDVKSLKLNEGVVLLDTPGIPSLPHQPGPHITLPVEQALETVSALVEALDPSVVVSVFQCAEYETGEEFLDRMAVKQGHYSKNAVPNSISAARGVVREWNTGHIPYYTYPPANTPAADSTEISNNGIAGMFTAANNAVIKIVNDNERKHQLNYIVLNDSLFAAEEEAGEQEQEQEEEEDEEQEEGDNEDIEDEEQNEGEEHVADVDEDEDADTDRLMEAADDDAENDDDDEDEVFFHLPGSSRQRYKKSIKVVKAASAPSISTSAPEAEEMSDDDDMDHSGEAGTKAALLIKSIAPRASRTRVAAASKVTKKCKPCPASSSTGTSSSTAAGKTQPAKKRGTQR